MKRRLFKLIIFLLLGAVVNVAVAWGCAWSDKELTDVWREDDLPKPYIRSFDRTADDVDVGEWPLPHRGNESLGLGITITAIGAGDRDPAEKPYRGMTAVLCRLGWPMRALSMSEWHEVLRPSENVVRRSVTRNGGIEIPIPEGRMLLPYRPIWPGFAINTLFYAALLWLPFAPFATRRIIRKRRGRCVRCGYDLRGAEHDVCPECGGKR